MFINGTLIDDYSFGLTGGIKQATLSGTYTAPSSGLYTLYIENTRDDVSTTCLYNYIDDISLKPSAPELIISLGENIPCATGGNVLLSISAGFSNKGKDYWIWMSITGTYPGFKLNGVYVPLNPDVLFKWGLANPNFPGSSGFLGKLGNGGSAFASFFMPAEPSMMLLGFPIQFAYVITSPGPSLPLLDASNPVHIKYVP